MSAIGVGTERAESPEFLRHQLITYLGNKRHLVPFLRPAIEAVHRAVGRDLRCADLFTGSGAVARLLVQYSDLIVANDSEPYAAAIAECYLTTWTAAQRRAADRIRSDLNAAADGGEDLRGFIAELYAPRDDADVRPGERVFYTRDNARRLDVFASGIARVDPEIRPLLLGPLLYRASVHANTSGVFKGFHKDRRTGVGRFGGSGADALPRITGTIRLEAPVASMFTCSSRVWTRDARRAAAQLDEIDLVYLDPPYNQHPYGSNYFMLDLLCRYRRPAQISAVSGIPADWNRSVFNMRSTAAAALAEVVARVPARFVLLSYNDEGFVPPEEMRAMLDDAGTVREFRTPYKTFRGSRNLRGRGLHVTEHLYLLDKR